MPADQWGTTSILPVCGYTSAGAGIFFCRASGSGFLWCCVNNNACVLLKQWVLLEWLWVFFWQQMLVLKWWQVIQPLLSRMHIILFSIWVIFINLISSSSILSSTNNFDNVGAMISFICGRNIEPQGPIIIQHLVPHGLWLIMAPTLSKLLVELSMGEFEIKLMKITHMLVVVDLLRHCYAQSTLIEYLGKWS